jgi:hypothetical protein
LDLEAFTFLLALDLEAFVDFRSKIFIPFPPSFDVLSKIFELFLAFPLPLSLISLRVFGWVEASAAVTRRRMNANAHRISFVALLTLPPNMLLVDLAWERDLFLFISKCAVRELCETDMVLYASARWTLDCNGEMARDRCTVHVGCNFELLDIK